MIKAKEARKKTIEYQTEIQLDIINNAITSSIRGGYSSVTVKGHVWNHTVLCKLTRNQYRISIKGQELRICW